VLAIDAERALSLGATWLRFGRGWPDVFVSLSLTSLFLALVSCSGIPRSLETVHLHTLI